MRETATRVATLSLPKAFPSSQKKYLTGSRSDLRVPYREINLSPTHHSRGIEENPPLPVYDTSGPFSDPDCSVDIAEGLPKLRRNWIEERGDTELLRGLSSNYGRQRANDLLTFELRFPSRPQPRRALRGRNVTQMHYARKGIITPEMEFVALRESMRLEELRSDPAFALLHRAHPARSSHDRHQIAGLHLPLDKALHRLSDIRDIVRGKAQIVGYEDDRAPNLFRPQRPGGRGNRFGRFSRGSSPRRVHRRRAAWNRSTSHIREVRDLLRFAVFEYLEIVGLEAGNVAALRIGDHRIHLHKIDGHSDHGTGGLPAGCLWSERRRPKHHQPDGAGIP